MYKIAIALVLMTGLAACQGNTRGQNTALGAGAGGLVGAGIAAAAGANTTATLLAAGAGAAAGGILGAATTPDNSCVDSNGNRLPPGQYVVNGTTINCN
ncbi:MAG: hypothetical protein AAF580_12650 [Pseudomonadota bacterium]